MHQLAGGIHLQQPLAGIKGKRSELVIALKVLIHNSRNNSEEKRMPFLRTRNVRSSHYARDEIRLVADSTAS